MTQAVTETVKRKRTTTVPSRVANWVDTVACDK